MRICRYMPHILRVIRSRSHDDPLGYISPIRANHARGVYINYANKADSNQLCTHTHTPKPCAHRIVCIGGHMMMPERALGERVRKLIMPFDANRSPSSPPASDSGRSRVDSNRGRGRDARGDKCYQLVYAANIVSFRIYI